MIKRAQKKNYYFIQTMEKEIKQYEVISFAVFDGLLLRNVLFSQDIFKLLAKEASTRYGILDFHFLRMNLEDELRKRASLEANPREDITLLELYEEIRKRYPEYPVEQLMELELQLVKEYSAINPLVKRLYDCALGAGKKVVLFSDTVLPEPIVEKLLWKWNVTGYTKLYTSGNSGVCKGSGNLYRKALSQLAVAPEQWLHIGANQHTDFAVPRSMRITAGFIRCPRDWFFMKREQDHQEEIKKTGQVCPAPPFNDSLEFSVETAQWINREFTAQLAPTTEPVITAEQVSMMFNMSSEKIDNIKEYVIRFLKRQLNFQEFWALQDVSFCVRRGEKLGLVGLNGSGKSTMLKVVSGVLKPTRGKVSVAGKIAPLIELGAGFDLNLSARENVFLNGAILGHGRAEMEKYYDSIIDFAELQNFQDVAIKNFSSGMIARLGFAIATCNVPDILIIDEILSVGDFEFRKKCHQRMEKLTGEGATVLFVSHSAGDIINMCDRAIWLDHGRMIAEGESEYIVQKYLNK